MYIYLENQVGSLVATGLPCPSADTLTFSQAQALLLNLL